MACKRNLDTIQEPASGHDLVVLISACVCMRMSVYMYVSLCVYVCVCTYRVGRNHINMVYLR